jgi:RNA polymerase sigma-70 factor (ECF subfamily)
LEESINRRAYETARAAFPELALDFEPFRRAWERRESAGSGRAGGAADTAADLYLATACDQGVPDAWQTLERAYRARLHGLLRRRGASENEADGFLAELPTLLFEPPADGRARTRIGTYDGTGTLFSWLAVVALRTVHHRRRDAAGGPAAIDSSMDVPTRRSLPASNAIGEESARRFAAAVTEAWRTLTPRERLAVLLKHRDGLRQREIARVLGVGEPRVSRLVESGLARLRDAVRARIPETPPGTSTPDSAVWQALTDVLAQHLASLPPAPHDLTEGPGD